MKETMKVVASFRGLPENGGKLPGGVASGNKLALVEDPEWTRLLSFAGQRSDMVNRIIRQKIVNGVLNTKTVSEVEPALVSGGYTAANETFWPWAHNLEEYLRQVLGIEYKHSNKEWPEEFAWYLDMNRAMTEAVLASAPEAYDLFLKVEDYQLARVARQARRRCLEAGRRAWFAHFVHTPWGTNLKSPAIRFLDQFARGVVAADVVGFHTEEWRDRYIRHLRDRFPERYVIDDSDQGMVLVKRPESRRTTELVVQPIGVDVELWERLACGPQTQDWLPKVPFFLFVARNDYTKATAELIRMIKRYFELYPERRGKVSWVIVVEKTRETIPAFKNYRHLCDQEAAPLQQADANGWQPLYWNNNGLLQPELAPVYREAGKSGGGIVVCSWEDGFGMVFNEAAASQHPASPAALLLSKKSGCSQTAGVGALEVRPGDIDQMADAHERALNMSLEERIGRWRQCMEQVCLHSLPCWARSWFPLLARRREEEERPRPVPVSS